MQNQETKEKLKLQVHEHLLSFIDLRTIKEDELHNETFRQNLKEKLLCTLKEQNSDPCYTDQIANEVIQETLGLGPIELLLEDPDISEIMINGHQEIYVEHRGVIKKTLFSFISKQSLRLIITRIVSPLGRRIDESSPMVDARLPDGSRFNAIIEPLSLKGPVVTIRKFKKQTFILSDLVQNHSISQKAADFIDFCVRERKNIVISGGTGSGKTTFLNAISKSIPHSERIITIEDAAELKLFQKHTISLESRPANVENKGSIRIRDLLKNALRMRPDRIIIGECRSDETLDMLQAMNTGHDGSLTTLHANSPRDALARLETMILMSGFDLPLRAIREQIASAIDIIVHVSRFKGGHRTVTHITEVCHMETDQILTHHLFEIKSDTKTLHFCNQQPMFFSSLDSEQKQKGMNILFGDALCSS